MEKAGCFSDLDKLVIHANICAKFVSLAALTDRLQGMLGVVLSGAVIAADEQGARPAGNAGWRSLCCR